MAERKGIAGRSAIEDAAVKALADAGLTTQVGTIAGLTRFGGVIAAALAV